MSRYKVFTTPQAFKEIKALPGNIRQRVRRAIKELADDPRPQSSKALSGEVDQELWRLRLDRWRMVYMISEADLTIDVIAVRKRPPYDYRDLEALLEDLS